MIVIEFNEENIVRCNDSSIWVAGDKLKDAERGAKIINNHDRMMKEIAELKFSEVDLVNRNEDLLCIIDDLTRIARALDKPERHTNSQHKRAKRDLRKLIEKLNQEGGGDVYKYSK
ncbi:coil containing protein [Vibrio phage 1.278.O._10N.286.54.E8]|nr:coil containing protein [Vibrio phage 1.278.O._10N.286.54.E8]